MLKKYLFGVKAWQINLQNVEIFLKNYPAKSFVTNQHAHDRCDIILKRLLVLFACFKYKEQRQRECARRLCNIERNARDGKVGERGEPKPTHNTTQSTTTSGTRHAFSNNLFESKDIDAEATPRGNTNLTGTDWFITQTRNCATAALVHRVLHCFTMNMQTDINLVQIYDAEWATNDCEVFVCLWILHDSCYCYYSLMKKAGSVRPQLLLPYE